MSQAEDFIEQACSNFRQDDRIVAAWLEGSHATGDADEWSDIDLHLGVADDHFDGLSRDPGIRSLVTPLAKILGAHRFPFGPGLVLLNATLSGPTRLDLYVEQASACTSQPRINSPLVLFDHTGVTETFRIDAGAALVPPAAQLSGLVNRYAYGFMWPARLLGRQNHATALMNATIIAHEFLVPALLAQERPEQMHRELLSSERFLSPRSRRRLETILEAIAAGYLARKSDGGAAFAAAHTELINSILLELREACGQHGVDWPMTAEHEIRSYLRTNLNLDL